MYRRRVFQMCAQTNTHNQNTRFLFCLPTAKHSRSTHVHTYTLFLHPSLFSLITMWGHFRWTLLPLFAAHALAQYPSSNTSCTRHYTVEDGDTCDIIGQKTFTSTYQIMALNLPQAGPDCYSLETGVVRSLLHDWTSLTLSIATVSRQVWQRLPARASSTERRYVQLDC